LSLSAPTVLAASILAAVLMSGCPSEPPPGPEPCEAQRGYLQVCATYFGDPAEGSVLIRVDPQDDMPIESLFGTDGCTTVELSPGPHEWSAQHLTDTCVSEYQQVTIGECEEVTEVSVELDYWCVDGR
jgi:hypothetical protein